MFEITCCRFVLLLGWRVCIMKLVEVTLFLRKIPPNLLQDFPANIKKFTRPENSLANFGHQVPKKEPRYERCE